MTQTIIDALGIGDQVLLWSITKNTREIAKLIFEKYGKKISHDAVARWLRKQRAPIVIRGEEKTLARREVTKEFLQDTWFQITREALSGMERARNDSDEEGIRRWLNILQRQVEMLLKTAPVVIVPAPTEPSAQQLSALEEWARRVLHG